MRRWMRYELRPYQILLYRSDTTPHTKFYKRRRRRLAAVFAVPELQRSTYPYGNNNTYRKSFVTTPTIIIIIGRNRYDSRGVDSSPRYKTPQYKI